MDIFTYRATSVSLVCMRIIRDCLHFFLWLFSIPIDVVTFKCNQKIWKQRLNKANFRKFQLRWFRSENVKYFDLFYHLYSKSNGVTIIMVRFGTNVI